MAQKVPGDPIISINRHFEKKFYNLSEIFQKNLINFIFRNPVKSCGEYCDGEDDTFTLASNNNNNNVGCSSNPCQNSCTCEVSCQDENDYVCVPPAGRPFVGKNCEWEAIVQCTANRSIRVSIPTGAVAQAGC